LEDEVGAAEVDEVGRAGAVPGSADDESSESERDEEAERERRRRHAGTAPGPEPEETLAGPG